MTTVRIHIQDLDAEDRPGYQYFTSDWSLPRKHRYTYLTDAKGMGAAEEAFCIFNAPKDWLKEWQKDIALSYKGPSVSVGDIVEVDGVEYLCTSSRWQTRDEALAVA